MKVIWSPEALLERADIWDAIANDNPRAAARIDELFSDAAARLGDHPKLGKPGKISGTRELIPHESYRLVYEIEGEALWILALIHTARLQPLFSPFLLLLLLPPSGEALRHDLAKRRAQGSRGNS